VLVADLLKRKALIEFQKRETYSLKINIKPVIFDQPIEKNKRSQILIGLKIVVGPRK
jgi:hypothetical protein